MGRQQHAGQQQGGQQGEQPGAEAAGGGHRGDGGEEHPAAGGEQPAQAQGEDCPLELSTNPCEVSQCPEKAPTGTSSLPASAFTIKNQHCAKRKQM